MLRRAIAGAMAAGASRFVYMDDPQRLAASAFADIQVDAEPLPCKGPESARHSSAAAMQMQKRQCAAILVLGGDGTSRAVVAGWREAVLLPLSTGTNNVFPQIAEATLAGAALGLVGSGLAETARVARQAKIIQVEIEGEGADLALIDAVVTSDVFTGARALLDVGRLRLAVLSRADPASLGMSSIGGLLLPVTDAEEGGLFVTFGGGGRSLRAALAPGRFETVPIASVQRLAPGEPLRITGPGMLAFDGERERSLEAGQTAAFSVTRSGPRVISVAKAMQLAAELGLLETRPGCS